MTALIKSIEDYLYETGRDVFFLELTLPKDDFDEKRFKSDWVKASQRMATEWLEDHQVTWAFTAPPGCLWDGMAIFTSLSVGGTTHGLRLGKQRLRILMFRPSTPRDSSYMESALSNGCRKGDLNGMRTA